MTRESRNPITTSYISGHHSSVTNAHAIRTIDNSVPYILPILSWLPPTFTLLDVGCGPGSITLDIAQRFPHATILGIDGSESVIIAAKTSAVDMGVNNARFAVGDALHLQDITDEGFARAVRAGCDVVTAHQVLMHTSDPTAVLRGMRAAAKENGGVVAVREADWRMMAAWPEKRGINLYFEGWEKMMLAKGAEPLMGRKLVETALRAGFRRHHIKASVGSWVYSTPDERAFWAGSVVERMAPDSETVRNGIDAGISGADFEEMKRGWSEWAAEEGAFFTIPCPQIVCKKVL